jgi:hypothetical protein
MVDRDRECGSKQGCLVKARAKHVAREMRERHGEPFHIYTCSRCGLYHVAHTEPRAIRVARHLRGLSPSPRRWRPFCEQPNRRSIRASSLLSRRFDAARSRHRLPAYTGDRQHRD